MYGDKYAAHQYLPSTLPARPRSPTQRRARRGCRGGSGRGLHRRSCPRRPGTPNGPGGRSGSLRLLRRAALSRAKSDATCCRISSMSGAAIAVTRAAWRRLPFIEARGVADGVVGAGEGLPHVFTPQPEEKERRVRTQRFRTATGACSPGACEARSAVWAAAPWGLFLL